MVSVAIYVSQLFIFPSLVIPSILDVKLTTEFSHLPNTSHGLNSLLYCRVMNAVSTSFRYNWYRNNVRILGAYLPVYRHMSANGMQNTNYSCQVSHNCGSNSEINTSIVVGKLVANCLSCMYM